MPTHLAEGDPAPDFSLPTDRGDAVSLRDFAGRWVVLYFYPRDDTPGCTTEALRAEPQDEACSFRDAWADIEREGAVVLGVSTDSVRSHQRFRDKHALPFTLLADTEHAAAEAYGVWAEKKRYGRAYMGVERSTFVIGPDGRIAGVWPKVKPEGHAAEVLAWLREQKGT